MGILNVTPDSFSDGGRHFVMADAVRHATQMARDGAEIIDIGGESSRPGSDGIGVEEELGRVLPVIKSLAGRLNVPLSIDTRRAEVARAAVEAGCGMINDITACRDPDMARVIGEFGVSVVLMHMKGAPKSMQVKPTYQDVVREVRAFLEERVLFLKHQGIEDDRIIIDPGIGFGKRFRDNLDILSELQLLQDLGYPVLVGASRKAFLGELLDAAPGDRLSGSLAVAAWSHRLGADIIRVHDVKETVDLLRVLDALEYPR
ncbi:MAG: dihydropteroate synthase [Candidatus Krumholzibacteria bacterium]|nr:dihydropteroate synthase [Candidatus Krumholzibacteria bacterium]